MSERIDARGLSCPQPVVMTRTRILAGNTNAFEVIVDTGAARDNVTRMAASLGWKADVREEGGEFVLSISKN
jgi:tRNA 2-thiouridine synthesizing protein A